MNTAFQTPNGVIWKENTAIVGQTRLEKRLWVTFVLNYSIFLTASIVMSTFSVIYTVKQDAGLPLREEFEIACKLKLNELYAEPRAIKIDIFQFS